MASVGGVTDVVTLKHLSPQEVDDVRHLLLETTASDRTPPLSEHVMLHLPGGGDTDVRIREEVDVDALLTATPPQYARPVPTTTP